jgi:hypothetical protein
MANNKHMLVLPVVLGYIVGAVGMYVVLSRTAPISESDPSYRPLATQAAAPGSEVIQLFVAEDARKAA